LPRWTDVPRSHGERAWSNHPLAAVKPDWLVNTAGPDIGAGYIGSVQAVGLPLVVVVEDGTIPYTHLPLDIRAARSTAPVSSAAHAPHPCRRLRTHRTPVTTICRACCQSSCTCRPVPFLQEVSDPASVHKNDEPGSLDHRRPGPRRAVDHGRRHGCSVPNGHTHRVQ